MDAYVAHNNDLGQLLINQSPPANHWIGFSLQATKGNREAVGARLVVTTDGGTQTRWVVVGNGFLSDSDRRIHFGLGKSNSAKHVAIHWPDGSTMALSDLPANRYYPIRQGDKATPLDLTPVATHPTNKIPALKLDLGENDPLNRIAYLQLLTSVLGMESSLPELEVGSQDADPVVREAVVDLLIQYKTPQALRLLTHALDDPTPSVAVKAVDALCAYEDEASVRWMLRAFNSPEESVRVKLADCFGYFYQEEEAVIHRKYLALPYLIKLLNETKPSVQIASARALANAERYRAVQPLINKLTDNNLEVRAESIRALGLIREGKAMSPIFAALQSPTQNPAVYAQALIALKRLAIPEFSNIQHDFIFGTGYFEAITKGNRLDTVRLAIENKDDGIVLNQDDLVDSVANWAKQSLPTMLQEDKEENAIKLISVLQLNPRPESLDILQALKTNENPAIRAKALVALIGQDQKSQNQIINAGLSDP
ncbi:MAG: HEAT repeat domain-containing protein, partial [Candidatus Methylumidiphilus sp.]